MRLAALVMGVFALAGATADSASLTEEQQHLLDRHLSGRVSEAPVSCIHAARVASPRDLIVVSDRILLFRVTTSLIYRNDLQQECPHMALSPYIPNIASHGSSICRGDIVTTDRGSCVLGDFVPYRTAR